MKTAQSDFPKMHMIYFSTVRGISNPDGAKERVYYGKVFRVPKDIVAKKKRTALGSIENREIEDLEQRFINASCVKDGNPAISEAMERCEVFDPDTGDILVMYRVPYKSPDEQPPRSATTPPSLSRHARRAAAKQGHFEGGVMPIPPNTSQEARQLIGRVLLLLNKHAPDRAFKLPATLAAEQRALALLTVAAHELSSMPPSPQRQAIITQMGAFLGWLVDETDDSPPMPALSEEDVDELVEQGIGERISLGPYDTDKPN